MRIYLDYAAATPVLPEVVEVMAPYWNKVYGNPSSVHSFGQEAREAVEKARQDIAHVLRCSPNEIIFTGSGTESAALAILGAAKAQTTKKHLITTQIEHPAVFTACQDLEMQGYEVTYLPVNTGGMVDLDLVKSAITDQTFLISVMYANNEIGTIEPIAEIGEIAHKHGVLFHTDACQATGSLDLDVTKLHVDLMTINASKIYGPKGVGALYIKNGVQITPLMAGGGQERDLRGGTENVAGIVGIAKALQMSEARKAQVNARLRSLRDEFIKNLLTLPGCYLNGSLDNRLVNNINIGFKGVEAQNLLFALDKGGIAVSTSSACSAADTEPSHVILAIGRSYEQAFESLRMTIGLHTTQADLDQTIAVLKKLL